MRTKILATGLTTAAAFALTLAGTGTAGADPVGCPELPVDRVNAGIEAVAPPLPGSHWEVGGMGGSPDCTLNWVRLVTAGGTGSSPVQILFFDHQKFAGTPTAKAHAYTDVRAGNAPGEVVVSFRWQNPGDSNANPTGAADVRYTTMPQSAPRAIDPVPAQIAD